jgi:hypothetical protein
MNTITREQVREKAISLGWKPKDVITLCKANGWPIKGRTPADLEQLHDALVGSPTAVLDKLAVPFRPGEIVRFVGEFPTFAVGRPLEVELCWPQRTWLIDPQSREYVCNVDTALLRPYNPETQE